MDDILTKARTLWNERKGRGENPLICSFEGFYQHYGECANDAIQMLLCFCDHFKEVVQPLLLFSEEADFRRLIADHAKTRLTERKLLTYLKAFQNRFARHYMNMATVCEKPAGNVGPYRAKGRNAVAAAIAVLYDPDEMTEEEYTKLKKYGITWEKSTALFKKLLQIFSLISHVEPLTTIHVNHHIPHAIWTPNTVGYRMRMLNMATSESGHAICYYRCGGHEYIYENNNGPFPFMWSEFMKYIHEQMDLGHKIDLYHNRLWFINDDTNEQKSIAYYPMFSVEPDITYEGKTFYTYMPGTTDPIKLTYSAEFNSFRTRYNNIEIAVNALQHTESHLIARVQPITLVQQDTTIKNISPLPFMRLGHNIGTLHEVLPSFRIGRNKTETANNGQEGGRRKSKRQTRRKR